MINSILFIFSFSIVQLLEDLENEPFVLEELDFIEDESEYVLPSMDIEAELAALAKITQVPSPTVDQKDETVQKALVLAKNLEASEKDNQKDAKNVEALDKDNQKDNLLAITDGQTVEMTENGLFEGGVVSDERWDRNNAETKQGEMTQIDTEENGHSGGSLELVPASTGK